jgi:hypothetical protein
MLCAVKRSKQCPKCQSLRIGYLTRQVDIDDRIAQDKVPVTVAVAATRHLGILDEVRGEETLFEEARYRPLVGPLEAFVCTDCGYYETYVKDLKKIDWDKVIGFSWVNPKPPEDGPFR